MWVSTKVKTFWKKSNIWIVFGSQQAGGVHSVVTGDGMSRAPVVQMPTACKAR